MNRLFRVAIFASLFLLAALAVYSQEKRVKVVGIEVNDKPITSKFKVKIIDGNEVLDAITDENGFVLPAKIVGKNVGVIFEFKKHILMFFFVSAANFNEDWIVGVDTKPFNKEYIGGADPSKTALINYIRFPSGNESKPAVITVVGKPSVTVTKLN